MKKSRFTEEQIVAVLQEHAAGAQASELCRRHGISTATLYGWRTRYGGMNVNELRRLKTLEDENARLKRLVAQQALDNLMLKELLGTNG